METLPRDVLYGTMVRLRLPRKSDIPLIVAACADSLIRRFLHAIPDPYGEEDAHQWITASTEATWMAGGATFAIADRDTDQLVGAIGIERVTPVRRQGEVGYWVAPWARGRGVARDATVALTDWAFQHGFARMELLTEHENTASQRVALACGYRREGVRRCAGVGRDGSCHDLVAWARLWDDPPPPTPRPLPDLPDGQLTDGTVTLRPLRMDDAPDVYAVRSLPDVVCATVPPVPPDPAAVALACGRAESHWLAGERVDLTIRDAATDRFAGEIGLYFKEPAIGQAMVGYHVAPAWRGRGYAVRALRLLVDWAFTQTGIARIVAGTAATNIASQHVLERAGFQREGLLRGQRPTPDGQRTDDLLYAVLAPAAPRTPDTR